MKMKNSYQIYIWQIKIMRMYQFVNKKKQTPQYSEEFVGMKKFTQL